MKLNNLIDIIKMGNISVSKFLLKKYKKLGITSDEFLFIVYLMNEKEEFPLDSEKISRALGNSASEVLSIIYSLKEKNIIDMVVKKDGKKAVSETLTLEPFYNKLSMMLIDYINEAKDNKDNAHIYELFEKEFGRTLSPIEYEIINAWLESNINEEIIAEALKEATFNGVSNFRYIDKILHEWGKKGIKTASQAKKKRDLNRKEKKEPVEVFDYNWLEEDNE